MGLAHKRHPVHGVQFHPESIASEHGHDLLANFLGLAGFAPRRRNTTGKLPPDRGQLRSTYARRRAARNRREGRNGRDARRRRDADGARDHDVGRRHAGADGRLPDGAARARGDGRGDHRRGPPDAGEDDPRRGAGRRGRPRPSRTRARRASAWRWSSAATPATGSRATNSSCRQGHPTSQRHRASVARCSTRAAPPGTRRVSAVRWPACRRQQILAIWQLHRRRLLPTLGWRASGVTLLCGPGTTPRNGRSLSPVIAGITA